MLRSTSSIQCCRPWPSRNRQATYDYVTAKVMPAAPAPEQFADAVSVLGEQNPNVKQVDLTKVLDASFFQDAENRKVGQ